MKKVVFYFILFFLPYLVFSQSRGMEAEYKIIMTEDKKLEEISPDLASRIGNKINSMVIKAELLSNKEESIFRPIKSKSLDSSEQMAFAWCSCGNLLFSNINDKNILYNNERSGIGIVSENEFLIEKPMDTNWVLSGESKEINEILCYKATQVITYSNSVKEFTKTVTAWYAPSIPYSSGPNGYGGLPGLIVELHDQRAVFGLDKIKFLDTEPKIIFPEKGKKVTYDEYNKEIGNRVKQVEENIKSMESNR